MVVGEGPGVNENKKGRPWIGQAGTETKNLFFINGINPSLDVYFTNMVKCMVPDNGDPSQEQLSACESYLIDELLEIEPEIIITLGRFSARFFLDDDIYMDRVNGIPFHTDFGIVLPIIHPAAGLRHPDEMVKVQYGFGVIKAVLEGKVKPREYSRIKPVSGEYWESTSGLPAPSMSGVPDTVAVDTEWAQGKPFCLTATYEPGMAHMVRTVDNRNLEQLNRWIWSDHCEEVVIHNAAYDIPVLHQMGVQIPTHKLRDSMVAAYLLQSEPQGLKDLAWRLCGLEMNDYSGVVRPYRFKKAMAYLEEVLEYEWPDPEEVLEFKKGEAHVRKPQNITRLVSSIIKDVENPEKDTDPYMRWEKIRKDRGRSDIPLIEHNVGRLWDGDLSDAPLDVARKYACGDSDSTFQIWPILKERIISEGMWDTFMVDMGVMPMVADMMRFGIKVDPDFLPKLGDTIDQKLIQIHGEITRLGGKDINPNSSQMVHDLLYKHLKLGKTINRRMAKKQSATMTGDEILARMEPEHPVVKWIREYRRFYKLKSSYVNSLPTKIGDDGRIHPTIRITRIATGRIAFSDPNLTAIPVRTKEGREIRDAFIAEDGCWIGCCDYSQVEMRVAADQSRDRKMCRIFTRGEDIHNKTASEMFGIPESRLDSMKHRYPAKRVGFGVLNDISAYGLQRELIVGGADESDWPVDRCQELIDTWFDIYSGIRNYMDENRNYAARYGKIVDMWGRVRWIPWAKTKSRWKKEKGLKQAGNTPIQSGAQGVMKRAMVELQKLYTHYRRVEGKRVVPLIQIHDDIVGEYEKSVYEEVMKKQKVIMEKAGGDKMRVPLLVDMKRGERWGSAEKYNPTP
jgi:uracil-DNA glycosylase family 4